MRRLRTALSAVFFLLPLAIPTVISLMLMPTQIRRIDPVVFVVVSLGIWIAFHSIQWQLIGRVHGWHRPSIAQATYSFMTHGSILYLLGGSWFWLIGNVDPLLRRSFFFQLYGFAVVYGLWHVVANCTVFRVNPESRVIRPDGRVLGPGDRYMVWTFTWRRWCLFNRRTTLPCDDISMLSQDALTRTVHWQPTVEIDFCHLDSQSLPHFSLADFYDLASAGVATVFTSWARQRPFVDIFERRCPGTVIEVNGIRFRWSGDLFLHYEAHQCSCGERTCPVCTPREQLAWHA